MRNHVQDVLAQLKGIWGRLDGGQRFVVAAVATATIVGLGAIVWFAGRPSYETIYTARGTDDIARVKQALQQAGITWTVDASGRGFQVERSKAAAATMAIAEQGLLAGEQPAVGGGLSLIEDAETKAWRLDAAARAQAAAAIQNLDGVLQVTVTASRPRRQPVFRDRDAEQRASATVVLRLKPGVAFEPLARAAASLASSQLMVPQQNIDVVSAAGNLRWRYDPDREAGGASSEFLALQRTIGEDRTRAAQERLDQLWPGKTSVSVIVELDPEWQVVSERVLPSEPLVRSEKIKKDETTTTAGKGADGEGGNSTRNETRDREFVTDIGERRSGKLMPELKRMTVAVLYDRSLEQTQGFQKEDLVNAVKAIVGWDPVRDRPEAFRTLVGDFTPYPLEPATAPGPGIAEVALRWGPTVGQALGVIVVVLFLRGLFRRAGRVAAVPAAAAAGGRSGGAGNAGGPAPADADESLPPEEQQKRMRREIERSIVSDPAALAKLLETWLVEQKS